MLGIGIGSGIGGLLKKKRADISASTIGQNPAFTPPADVSAQGAPQPMPAMPAMPALPDNFGFNDLAGYENQQGQQYATNLKNTLAQRRGQLSQSLTDQGKSLFDRANPGILEDLNSRGVLSSPTAVATAQSNALRDINLSNQGYLNDFDTAATNAGIGADHDVLNNNLDLRRSQLESKLQNDQANQEQSFAEGLAKTQNRNSLTNSLIGVGGNVLTGGLSQGGFLRGILGGGGGGTTGGTGTVTGGGATGVPGAPGAATGALGMLPVAGLAAGGVLGYQSLSDKGKSLIAPMVNPVKTVSTVGKSISKAFCFDANTPVTLADGSSKAIKNLNLGEETKGGMVKRISVCMCEDGDLFTYFGTTVTGSHAVMENGCWIRVEDSLYSTPIRGESIVYSIVTGNHLVWIEGNRFADEFETDEYEFLNPDESLEEMNRRDGYVRVN